MAKRMTGLLGLWLALPAGGASADTFDWLGGQWCGQLGEAQIEESWTSPAGGNLLGMSRTLAGGEMQSFEYMRIETSEGKPQFVAQPGGAPPTAFPLSAQDAQSATFHNPGHDFPQAVRYWREGDQLRAAISGPDDKGGEQTIEFAYQRCKAPG